MQLEKELPNQDIIFFLKYKILLLLSTQHSTFHFLGCSECSQCALKNWKKMRHSRAFLNFMKVSFVKYENITFPPMQSVCANVLTKHNPPPLADKFCLLVWIRVIAYDMHMFCFKDKLILSQEVSYFWAKRINYDSKYPWLLPGVLEHLVIWGMFLGFLLRGAISEVWLCVCQWDNFLCGSLSVFWFSSFDSHDPVIVDDLDESICHWWSMIFNI